VVVVVEKLPEKKDFKEMSLMEIFDNYDDDAPDDLLIEKLQNHKVSYNPFKSDEKKGMTRFRDRT